MTHKILTLLGFAAKAGKLSYGMDASKSTLSAGKSHLIAAAGDVSDKSKKEIAFFAGKSAVPVQILETCTIKDVSAAIGRKCGILSVNDSGFANALLKAYVEGGNAYDE